MGSFTWEVLHEAQIPGFRKQRRACRGGSRRGEKVIMLALSRKKNEALVINNNIEVTVLEIRGDQVKIGVAAPKDVPIYRKEVYLQIQNANREANSLTAAVALQNMLG